MKMSELEFNNKHEELKRVKQELAEVKKELEKREGKNAAAAAAAAAAQKAERFNVALLNMLEDIREEKKKTERQREATLNMLEDIKESRKDLIIKKAEIEKSLEELKKLDELKNVFLSMTSHELKTPITPIKMQAEYLLSDVQGKLNDSQKKSVRVILRNVNHLNNLLSDVLDSAKLEADQLKMFPKKTDLKDLIQEIVDDMEHTAHQKNMPITCSVEKLPLVMIDRERFRQVLVNLLGNAIKYTPAGGKIAVSAKKQNQEILVTVTDNGAGIPPNMVKKIFDKFVQVSPSYKLKKKGTGLGLAICKGIVTKWGGKIWAENKGGASFHFTIPKNKNL